MPGRVGAELQASGWWWLVALVAVVLASVMSRLWLATSVDVVPDEAYYHTWSAHPSLTYLDHPPMTAWLLRAFHVPAGGALALRSVAIAMSTGALCVGLAMGVAGRSTSAAVVVTLLAALSPGFGVGSALLTPDVGLLLCWTMALWALERLERGGGAGWMVMLGGSFGAGLLFKAPMGLVGLVVLLALVVGERPVAGVWRVVGPVVVGALAAAPIYVLGLSRGDILVFQSSRLEAAGWRWWGPLEALGGWMGVAGPVLALAGLVGVWRIARRWRSASLADRVMALSVVVPLGVYVVVAALVPVEANWVLPALPGALVLTLREVDGSVRRWPWALGLGLSGLIGLLSVLVVVGGVLPVDGLSAVRGWKGWATEVAALGACERALVVTDRYQEASELRFYGGVEAWPAVAVRGTGYVEAVEGRPTAFDAWWSERMPGCVVLVTDGSLRPGPRLGERIGRWRVARGDRVYDVVALEVRAGEGVGGAASSSTVEEGTLHSR